MRKNTYVLRKHNNTFTLDVEKPEELLMYRIFNFEYDSMTKAQANKLRQNAERMLSLLKPEHAEVMKLRCGFNGYIYTLKEIGELIGKSVETVRSAESHALRYLRNPKLRKIAFFESYPERFGGNGPFAVSFKDIFLEEIKLLLLSRDISEGAFFKNVFEKNGFNFLYKAKIEGDAGIDELEFSVRTHNCLKRSGINTLQELVAYSPEELKNIRNLGKKSYEETLAKLKEIRSEEPLNDEKIIIEIGDKCFKYDVNLDDLDTIATELFKALTKKKNILDYPLSPRTTSLLLTQGFFYIEQINENYGVLTDKLRLAGLDFYAKELSDFENYVLDGHDELIEIAFLSTSAADMREIANKVDKTLEKAGYLDLKALEEYIPAEAKIAMLYDENKYARVVITDSFKDAICV